MTLVAHTNAPGVHVLRDIRVCERNGNRWNWSTGQSEEFSENVYIRGIDRARSEKPFPIHGDRKSVYPYSRAVRLVMEERPYLIHTRHTNGIDPSIVEYDYVTNGWISVNHTPFIYTPYKGGLLDNSRAEADVKALNRLNELKTQMGADLAQARQTVDMFAANVQRAARVLLALKRGVANQIPEILGVGPRTFHRDRGRSIANYWLEYQYGWKPLAQSVHDTQELVHQVLDKGYKVTATAKSEFEYSTEFPYRDEQWIEESRGKVRTVLKATLDSPTLQKLNAFGLANPASIAWEVVPWSFAIDWFVPVGNTLEACTAAMGFSFDRGWQTVKQDYMLSSSHNTGWMDWWSTCTDGGYYQEKGHDFWRVPYYGFPRPQFYADTTPYSTPRALNALALVRQLFR